MFCSLCGSPNAEGKQKCARCGAALQPSAAPSPAGAPPGFPPVYSGSAETSGKAIASLICGILFFVFPSALAAVILGHLSLSEIRKSGGRIVGQGLATAGLVLGYIGLAAIPFILIVAAIAIPNLLRARMAANEASAVGSLRVINTAEISYNSIYGNGFAPSLETLGGGGGAESCDHAQLIDSVLGGGMKNGYGFAYAGSAAVAAAGKDCTTPGVSGYSVTADPITRGTTGQRGFYTDQTAVIRVEPNGTATTDSSPLN
ncbi:MAG TPA: DUF4190 domain-containing protein [Candidatus Acidoferrum sp.]|nr:DUF4190 domain-containing protein [Candidatus Acidoferrum sp.]